MTTSAKKVGAGRTAHNLLGWLLLAYLLFVIYGSLVPLDFRPRPLAEAFTTFVEIPFLELGIGSRADWVANLLLFIPLAFLTTQLAAGLRNPAARLFTYVLIVAGAVVLAIGIEFTQLFFPPRTVSQNDILAEGLGGLVGTLLGITLGPRFRFWLDAMWRSETNRDRSTQLLHAYLVLLLLFNILPLDLTISPVELFHKWRDGKIVLIPFAKSTATLSELFYEILTDIAIWIPVGILWAKFPRPLTTIQIAARGFLAASTIEALQLFVYSRMTDVTDILMGTIGVALGGLLTQRNQAPTSATGISTTWLWLAAWAAWLCAILAIFWFPFNFTRQSLTWQLVVEAFTRTPFSTYYYTSEYHAINEALRKLGFFFPAGFLVGTAFRHRDKNPQGGLILWTAILASLAALVEAGQLLLPGKVADLTDLLLETCGGILGLLSARWIFSKRYTPHPSIMDSPPPVSPPVATPSHSSTPTSHVLAILALAATGFVLARLPGVPYNVRELLPAGFAGIIAAIGLAAVIYLAANSPFLLLETQSRRRLILFPIILTVQGILVWTALRLSVPLESIHDIVGTPILGWPWEWELLLRFIALHQVIAMQLVGAVLITATLYRPAHLVGLVYWIVTVLLLAWPLHLVVVEWAATDNLTELMRDGGSFLSSSLLATGLLLVFLSGTALGTVLAVPSRRRQLLIVALMAVPLASICFLAGLEPILVKYGKVFSAMQFLLSPDREHYLPQSNLQIHYALAHSLIVATIAILQLRLWRTIILETETQHSPSRKREQNDTSRLK
jgi:glycopeptide antibiotics resistance protein